MMLRFKHWDHTPLRNPPLTQVIWQVKFKPILRIGEEMPTKFQEQIRDRFPDFTVRVGLQLDKGGAAPSRLTNEYVFKTGDKNSEASLGIDFLALTVRKYQSWKDFSKDITRAYTAFRQVYGKPSITRIGLRYINEVTPENTKPESAAELIKLIHPDLTHLIVNEAWLGVNQLLIQLSLNNNGENLALRMAFESGRSPSTVLDYDYFAVFEGDGLTKLTPARLLATLDKYHSYIYDAFRWSITETGFSMFRPMKRKATK